MLEPDVQRRYEDHLAADLESANSLRTTLEQYLAHLESAFEGDAVFNLELAQAIGRGCLSLLDDAFDARPDDERRAIQAACIYFVDAEDGDDDLETVMGFDDDALVFNHVARRLGRADLVIDVE